MTSKIERVKKWFKDEVWQRENIAYFIIAELIFWSPVIFCAIMAIFNSWWWTGVVLVIGFWAGPFTPAVPLQIALMFGLKKIYSKIKNKKEEQMKDFDIREYLELENKVRENGITSLTPEEYEALISVRKADTEKALDGVNNEPVYYISDSGGSSMKLQENEFDSIEVILLDGQKFTIEEFFQKFSGEGLSLNGVRIILKSLVRFDLWDKETNYETKLLGEEYIVKSDYKIAELTSITKSIIYKK